MGDHTLALNDTDELLPPGYYTVNAIFATLWSLISAIGISGNVINLLIIPRVQADGGTKVFLTALSMTDLLTAVCLATSVITPRVGWTGSTAWDILSQACFVLGTWSSVTSAVLIFAVNLDRYLYVVQPYKYHEIITKKRALVGSLLVSISILVLGLVVMRLSDKSLDDIGFLGKNIFYVLDVRHRIYIVTLIGMWPLEVLVLAMYSRMFCIVRNHARVISAQENAAMRLRTLSSRVSHSHSSGPFQERQKAPQVATSLESVSNISPTSSRSKKEVVLRPKNWRQHSRFPDLKKQKKHSHHNIRNLRTTCLVTGCYMMLWMPFTILVARTVYSKRIPHDISLLITYTVGKGNCCVNCFVYMFSRQDFKSALRYLFRCR
nr:alpha-1A adrenergic receptor-like [Lytechinus pictus]